ncbi:MAG: beta-hexosaminidase [Clostridium sp.]|nr:beta-hexosaminidase [Clostridium sp.]
MIGKGKKIIICIIMLVVGIIAGFLESIIELEEKEPPAPSTIAEPVIGAATGTDSTKEHDIHGSFISTNALIIGLYDRKINEMMRSMTIEEKVGQLFFIKNDNRFNESILEEYPVGGIILFASDFNGESPDSLREELAAFQEKSKVPLLIGVDEEGGSVIRLSKYSALSDHAFLSPRDLYNSGGYDAIREDTREKSELLLSYGINVNFAPVCDISLNRGEFMYLRSFGISPEETAEYVSIVVEVMNSCGMGSVLKHFPGYGNNADTHKSVVHDKRDYETFVNEDFLPFISGIDSGAECILVSHNIIECMDPENPASISPYIHELLRNEFAFDGVIITDDLMMGGVSKFVTEEESAVVAILAGNDMVLSTNYKLQYNAVLSAIENGEITEERIDQSVKRILRWKCSLGLIK